MSRKADMIVDLQFGSTGKGLIAGYLAQKHQYDVVVNANMPNAGHTFVLEDDTPMIHKVLPNGIVSPKCRWALIGPGSVFSIDRLLSEFHRADELGFSGFKVGVHPNAVLLTNEHRDFEKEFVSIGSTSQGSAAAMMQKIRRNPNDNPTIANGNFVEERIKVLTHEEYRNIIKLADSILCEGAQGFSLGINQEFYPYCTSRECTPSRFLSDMGIPHSLLREVIGTCRVHPIRVGNPKGGYSGDGYADQDEISWEDIGVEPELTTVTKRVRRVFTWSDNQIWDAIWECAPTQIFLNFCNYATGSELWSIRQSIGPMISYEGWGPKADDVSEVKHG